MWLSESWQLLLSFLNRLRSLRSKKFGKKDIPKQEPGATPSSLNGTPEKQKKVGDDDDDDDKDDDDDDLSGGEEVGGAVTEEEQADVEEEVEVESANQGLEEIERKIEKLGKVSLGGPDYLSHFKKGIVF